MLNLQVDFLNSFNKTIAWKLVFMMTKISKFQTLMAKIVEFQKRNSVRNSNMSDKSSLTLVDTVVGHYDCHPTAETSRGPGTEWACPLLCDCVYPIL